MNTLARSFLVFLIAAGSNAAAQSLPPVHALGPVLATSTEPLGSVSQARALPGGRVIVNDVTGRRALLFDSTLKTFAVIADSTSATANAYHSTLGAVIAYRGDSTLFADPLALSMLLIDPDGRIVRTMALPAGDSRGIVGGPFGTPRLDQQGRLVYRIGIRPKAPSAVGGVRPAQPDSAFIVRFDLVRRTLDTVVKFGIPEVRYNTVTAQYSGRTISASVVVVNPMLWTDDWAILTDGTIALVRGREFRIDLIDANDKMISAAKIPFEWQRLTDADKTTLLDSAKADIEKQRAAVLAARAAAFAATAPPGHATPPREIFNPPVQLAEIYEMADYRPAFRQGAALGDADGNLWIRTTYIVNGGAVYDVINNKGALIDRVQVPPGRVIAGFGLGGIVYMGVVDGNITRLERARAVIAGK